MHIFSFLSSRNLTKTIMGFIFVGRHQSQRQKRRGKETAVTECGKLGSRRTGAADSGDPRNLIFSSCGKPVTHLLSTREPLAAPPFAGAEGTGSGAKRSGAKRAKRKGHFCVKSRSGSAGMRSSWQKTRCFLKEGK